MEQKKVVDFQAQLKLREEENAKAGEGLVSAYRANTKEQLVELAKLHGLTGYSKYKKEELAYWLPGQVLRRDIMYRYFINLSDEEIAALERAVKSKNGCYMPEHDFEIMEFEFLMQGGYLSYDGKQGIIVPREVRNAYGEMNNRGFQKDRRRLDVIRSYCLTADWLYGVTPTGVLLELFNKYEEQKLDEKELLETYNRMRPYRLSTTLVDGFLVNDGLLDQKAYAELMRAQGDIPFYIPPKNEITSLSKYRDISTESQMRELCVFLAEEMGISQEDAVESCYFIDDIIHSGCEPEEIIQILKETGIFFDEKEQIEGFVPLLMDVWEHTRIITYRGHTPCEIAKIKRGSDKVIDFPRRQRPRA